MRYIPKSLKKYQKFIDSCPQIDCISPDRLSDRLLEHINKSRGGKLLLLLSKGNDKFEYFIPELDDIPSCFMENVWENCSLEDKIKIIDKYLDYFFQNCPQNRPTLQLLPKVEEGPNDTTLGYYTHNSKRIFIDLDKIENSSGIVFLSVIYHECTHAKDFSKIENEIMPRLLRTYSDVSPDLFEHPSLCDSYVMRMSATGFADNRKTGEKKYIEGKLKNDILRTKNFYSIFECTDIKDPNEVRTKEDFKKYLQSMLYFYSPVERFARTGVKRYFRGQLKHLECISKSDEQYMLSQVESERYIDKMLSVFKELLVIKGETKIDMKDFLDLAMQNKFYQKPTYFGKCNAMKFPEEAERIKRKYEKIVDQLYSNLLMKRNIEPEKFGSPSLRKPLLSDDEFELF